jgi:hypothetical protein
LNYSTGVCAAHSAHRVVATATKEDDIIGDIHAVQFTCSLTTQREASLMKFRALVYDELEIHHTPADPRWLLHTTRVIDAAVLRKRNVLGCVSEGESFLVSPDYSTRLETRNKVLTFVNGDIRENRCQHHEVGCCSSAEDPELAAKEGFFAACVEANLFLGEEKIECRKNQWGTMDDALTKENASIMVHNILPRVLTSSIPNWEEVGEEPAEEYRRMVRSKAWRTKCCLNDLTCNENFAIMTWSYEKNIPQ